MEVFEAFPGMYHCRYLPSFANFLLQNHIADYAKAQVELGRTVNLPLLANLSARFSNEEIEQISLERSKEYLGYLAANNVKGQIASTMKKWTSDQLLLLEKNDISARDITLISYIRSRNLKKFVSHYTTDVNEAMELADEIDKLSLATNTTSMDIYIRFLQNEIQEKSNLATKVIEASPAITFVFDVVHAKHTYIGGNVEDIMGYTSVEAMEIDDLVIKLTHPDDLEMLKEHIYSVIKENSDNAAQVEYRFRKKDGKYVWLRTYEVIFKRNEKGEPTEILGKTFEITDEKQTAWALEKREKQLLDAQSIAHIGSYEWNILQNKSQNTSEVYSIFEMDADQHFEEFLRYVHPDDIQKVRDAIKESFESGEFECEYRYVKNNREKVIWSLGRVEFKDGKPAKMVGTVQDVTANKKIERELIQKSEQLEFTNESLRQFAYVASHDLKEPLRKIMMFSDLVLNAEGSKVSDKSVSYLQKMQHSGRSLYRMVEDILSFSMLEARENKVLSDLNQLVAEVGNLLEENIIDKNATLRYKDLPVAKVIPSQFRQLFQNLILNSLKFSRDNEPPVIDISARITAHPEQVPLVSADKYLEIRVEDNGIGFPEEAKERIFDLFNRCHSKSKYEGTGLGLSISRRIVENHAGVIKAMPGAQGAVFTIVIPYTT